MKGCVMAKSDETPQEAPAETIEQESPASEQVPRAPALSDAIDVTVEKYAEKLEDALGDPRKHEASAMIEAIKISLARKNHAVPRTASKMLEGMIAEIDETLSKQLSAIMQSEKFQKLEGSWRGLQRLLSRTQTGPDLYVEILDCPRQELVDDMHDHVGDAENTEFYEKVYQKHYNTPGIAPYGIIIADYEFSHHPDDIKALRELSHVAAAAHCPVITSPSPSLMKLERFEELESTKAKVLQQQFEDPSYDAWRSLRDEEDTKYLVFAMPRTLARLPYGKGTNTQNCRSFNFEEVELGPNGESIEIPQSQFCWSNAAYSLAERITEAYWAFGWTTAIRGELNGGRVDELPLYTYRTKKGGTKTMCPTETHNNFEMDFTLSKLGMYSLLYVGREDHARFEGAQCLHQPKEFVNPAATKSSQMGAILPYLLSVSRVAHYLKELVHANVGRCLSRKEMEDFLNDWIKQFTLADENPSDELKAEHPFSKARIEVTEDPENVGWYKTQIYLKPWVFLERMEADITLVSKLPEQA